MPHALRLFLMLMLILLASERQAMAYTDPGSGALLWQGILASLIGIMFYLRKFASWFRKKP